MIHLECDNDETLMLAMGVPRRAISHHAGKGRVSKALSNASRSSDIGLIDEDPGQPPPRYLREFRLVEEAITLGLVLYRHPVEGKRLIEIRPDLEPWLYQIGPVVGVHPIEYRLPDVPSGLHQRARKLRASLLSYLAACRAAGSPHLTKLESWIVPSLE